MPKVPNRAPNSKRRVTKLPTRDEMDAAIGEEYSNYELNKKIQKHRTYSPEMDSSAERYYELRGE